MKQIFLFIFFLSSIWAGEEIQVYLSTSKPLCPVYLFLSSSDKSTFGRDYLEKVRSVLEFDIENSGYLTILPKEKSKDTILSSSELSLAFDFDFWRKEKERFVIKLAADNDFMDMCVFDASIYSYRVFSKIHLVGDLQLDRREVHKLFDDFLLEYLGKKGIAQTSILYTVRRDNPNKQATSWLSEVWRCDYDGENPCQLTFENSYCVSPVCLSSNDDFNPSFIYVSYKRGIPKIFINSKEKKEMLFSLRGNQLLPSISPRGDSLAFISDAAGRPDLFLQRLDEKQNPIGKPRQLFTAPRATQATSTFSPDGQKLAFVSDKDGSPRIYLIKIPKENNVRPYAHLITKKNRHNVTPAWSPDGTMLAYSSTVDRVRQIYIYDFSSGEERQITFKGENKENPCWAGDNLHIVYNTEYKTISELYIINLNSLRPIKITSGQGQKRFPAWWR